MTHKYEHLQMIQGIIKRLSKNSFLLKRWSVILVAAMFALAVRGVGAVGFIFLCISVLMFWGLDGYFLHQERLFNKLYDYVRKLPEGNIDFSMDKNKVKDKKDFWLWLSAVGSVTLLPFYGVLLLVAILFAINVLEYCPKN